MSILKLQERQTQLILQRSQAKDIIESSERELSATTFAIRQIKEYVEEEAVTAARIAEEDVVKFPSGDGPGTRAPSHLDCPDEDPQNDPEGPLETA